MDKAWRDWLSESLQKNCSLTDILTTFKTSGFDDATIIAAFKQIEDNQSVVIPCPVDYQALSNVRITQQQQRLNVRKIPNEHLQIYEIDDFMTREECDRVIAAVRSNLAPSVTGNAEGYSSIRTSSTCMLDAAQDPFIAKIDKRIADTIGINLLFSDNIEGQHYAPGQEFKAHFDYFTRGLAMHDAFTKIAGNRTWTFMIYLNDQVTGGGTYFPRIDTLFTPRTGKALAWNNLLPNGDTNPYSEHAGQPIISGEKIVITKWFRELANTPMVLA